MEISLKADEPLKTAKPELLGQRVPRPLHDRVEELCDLVKKSGQPRPTKARMIAALLLAGRPSVPTLTRLLKDYDQAIVRDALIDPSRIRGGRVHLPTRKPGPRGPQ